GAARASPPPPPPTHFHASGRRFTHDSSSQSQNPLTAITVSTAISEMSAQTIPLKLVQISRNSAESGHRDYSCLSCGVANAQLGPSAPMKRGFLFKLACCYFRH